MAATIELLAQRADAIDQDIQRRAGGKHSGVELASVLQEYRVACETLILGSYEHAATLNVEQKLWDAHLKVNSVFRQAHRTLKRNPDRVVELRKFHKNYLQFIKASQRFYRQHILSLDAQFDGIPELRTIAQKWKEHAAQPPPRPRIHSSLQEQVLLSCHQTLIHLGDLSRYRETELVEKDKERNWSPATGYYGLAAEIYPDSGHAHNQLAVISREDGDHFRSVYNLYRSLASKLPHPQAQANLELEFRRILTAWERGQLVSNQRNPDGTCTGNAVVAWFVRLHGKIYKGEEFAAHDELEGEVLSQLAVELKERSLDSILLKMVLINMAAEYFTTLQMQANNPPGDYLRTYFYFLRLNVKTFFVLLQIFQPELERLSEGHDVTQLNGERSIQLSDKITAVARRILPALRLYSLWFTRCWPVLNANIADTLTAVDIQELWKAYGSTLTLLASSFPPEQLPQERYMLEEDTDVLGFEPLIAESTLKLWYQDGQLKPKWTDVERNHPNVEMLMRVRDLLIEGVLLAQNPEAPLELVGNRFVYREAGVPSELLASPHMPLDGSPEVSALPVEMPLFPVDVPLADDQKSHSVAAASESASTVQARDRALNRMVDDLVGPEDGLGPLPEEDENLPPSPLKQMAHQTAIITDGNPASATLSITDLVNSVKNYKSISPVQVQSMFSVPMGRSGSTASIPQAANLPSIPDGQWNTNSIWNRQYTGTPGPSSPSMLNGNGFAANVRGSPMLGVNTGSAHTRVDSSNSVPGSNLATPTTMRLAPKPESLIISDGEIWGEPGSSNSQWASVYRSSAVTPTNGHYQNPNVGTASPLLFSSHPDRNKSSWGRTPPNGQGG